MTNSIHSQFNSFFIDIKNIVLEIYSIIHNFLSKYFDDTALGIFLIILAAALFIFIFRKISNR